MDVGDSAELVTPRSAYVSISFVKTLLSARRTWSFFFILWAIFLAVGVATDAAFGLVFGSHLGWRWDLQGSFGWAAGLSIVRWLVMRHASNASD